MRRLALRRDVLTELTTSDLSLVAGAGDRGYSITICPQVCQDVRNVVATSTQYVTTAGITDLC
jgi:hypothetical protein